MTDYTKFNLADFDERQKQVKTKGTVIALWVFAALSAVNATVSDFVHWTSGFGASCLFFGAAAMVYAIYTARKDSCFPVNEKDLNTMKITLAASLIIFAGVLGGFLPELLAGELAENLNEDGSIRTSAMMLAGSGLYCIGSIISCVTYSRRKKAEESEKG